MRTSPAGAALAAAASAVLLLAGCGGGAESGTTPAGVTQTAGAIPLASWQERMRVACTDFVAPANVNVPVVAVRTIHRAITELEAIGVPDQRADEVRALFAAYREMEAVTREVVADPVAARRDHPPSSNLNPVLTRRLLAAASSVTRLTRSLDIVPCAHIGTGRAPSAPEPVTTG